MLSEVIHSRHSYSAMPRARQPIHQRSVRSGPLVTFIPSDQNQKLRTIPLFLGAQTISSSFDKLRINPRLDRMLAYYKHEPTSTICRGFPVSCESVLIWYQEQVVTGSILPVLIDRTTSHDIILSYSGPQVNSDMPRDRWGMFSHWNQNNNLRLHRYSHIVISHFCEK